MALPGHHCSIRLEPDFWLPIWPVPEPELFHTNRCSYWPFCGLEMSTLQKQVIFQQISLTILCSWSNLLIFPHRSDIRFVWKGVLGLILQHMKLKFTVHSGYSRFLSSKVRSYLKFPPNGNRNFWEPGWEIRPDTGIAVQPDFLAQRTKVIEWGFP